MKLFKFLAHPVILIVSFGSLLIIGEKLGFFYIIILLIGLPGLYIHSLLGIAGILVLLLSQFIRTSGAAKCWLNIFGACLFPLSLSMFFANDTKHYNWNTFTDPTALTLGTVFSLFWIIYVVYQITLLFKINNSDIDTGYFVKT